MSEEIEAVLDDLREIFYTTNKEDIDALNDFGYYNPESEVQDV